MRGIQITRFGGPEVLEAVELPEPQPAPGMRVYEVTAAGVNYADTHQTEDSYLAPQRLPLVPGAEFAGTGPDGRRVVGLVGAGGYAERVAAADVLVWPIPDGVADGAALAVVLQGVTAWHAAADQRAPGRRRVGGRARRGRRGRHGRGAAGQGLGRRPGDRDRVLARRSGSSRSSLGADVAVDPAAEDLDRGAAGGQRRLPGRRRAGDDRRPGLRREPAGAGAVRPAGHVRDGVPDAADPGRPAQPDGPLDRGDRLLAGALLPATRPAGWTGR